MEIKSNGVVLDYDIDIEQLECLLGQVVIKSISDSLEWKIDTCGRRSIPIYRYDSYIVKIGKYHIAIQITPQRDVELQILNRYETLDICFSEDDGLYSLAKSLFDMAKKIHQRNVAPIIDEMLEYLNSLN